jgi:hypothetical protein
VKLVAVVLIVTALWVVLGAVLSGCTSRQATGTRPVAAGEAWLWESLDCHARLARDAALPASHPLARLSRSPSQPA